MTESERPDSDEPTIVGNSTQEGTVKLSPGTILLDRYEVLSLLGQGGMGSVFQVRHVHLKTEFALKVLNKLADPTVWRRFENEAKAASRLGHPNLIKVHDSGLLADGQPFFVMELIKGVTLADLTRDKGRLPVLDTLKIFIQVGFALAYAHEVGVIHRDLKPSNIMLAKNLEGSLLGCVKVVDLGIAKLTGIDEFNQQTLTRTGEVFGSPLYMSPEQCLGSTVDARTDLYSFGCAMFEALTGAPPLIGENALATMMKHQLEAPPSLHEASLGIEYPKAIEDIVTKLLAKEPNDRYANAQLLTHALVQLEQELTESTDRKSSTVSAFELLEKGKGNFNKQKSFATANLIVLVLAILAFILGYSTSVLRQNHLRVLEQKKAKEAKPYLVSHLLDPSKSVAPSKNNYITGSGPVSKLSADGKLRYFYFPSEPIGSIFSNSKTPRVACKTVSFPADAIIHLELNGKCLGSSQFLDRFGPDDIQELNLNDKVQTNPIALSALSRFRKLRFLEVQFDVGDEALPYIDRIPNLERLYVSNTSMTCQGIEKLKRFPQFTELACGGLKGVKTLIDRLPTTKITNLKVEDSNLNREDLRKIAKHTPLTALSLSENEQVDNEALKDLLPLVNLEYLFVRNCPVTSKCASTLKKFKSLHYFTVYNMPKSELLQLKRQLKGILVVDTKNNGPGALHVKDE
ncbi:MAG: protein kinase [Cyanobacteria bacterium SZAS-4]|nr:protein kinase [Cyanobacteria bacterium SZAS-4]